MSNIWFSSDLHLGHDAIAIYCNRPFMNAREMDDTIIDNFVRLIKKGDTLYIIGDFAFDVQSGEDFLNNFSGVDIHLILGNHDHKMPDWMKRRFKSFSYIKEITIEEQSITLCHFPMVSWNKSHFGAWMLHGHHHADISKQTIGKIMNVAVDVNDFNPVSFDQVKAYMKNRPDNWDLIPESARRR